MRAAVCGPGALTNSPPLETAGLGVLRFAWPLCPSLPKGGAPFVKPGAGRTATNARAWTSTLAREPPSQEDKKEGWHSRPGLALAPQ